MYWSGIQYVLPKIEKRNFSSRKVQICPIFALKIYLAEICGRWDERYFLLSIRKRIFTNTFLIFKLSFKILLTRLVEEFWLTLIHNLTRWWEYEMEQNKKCFLLLLNFTERLTIHFWQTDHHPIRGPKMLSNVVFTFLFQFPFFARNPVIRISSKVYATRLTRANFFADQSFRRINFEKNKKDWISNWIDN